MATKSNFLYLTADGYYVWETIPNGDLDNGEN